jgi:hypothetical protein
MNLPPATLWRGRAGLGGAANSMIFTSNILKTVWKNLLPEIF